MLADEYYRYAARRDLGLRPTTDVSMPRQCSACGVSTAADGRHGQRCIYNSSYTKLRHDSIGYTRAVRAGSGAEGSGAGEEEDEACSGDVDGEE